VSDLAEGDNSVLAEVGSLTSTLTVTNYPITGPVVSGPWQQPFICQTDLADTGDRSDMPRLQKVVNARPAQAVAGCYDSGTPPSFIAEPLVFTRTALHPVYSNVRVEAGTPLSADVLNCQLAPVNTNDYRGPFTPDQLERLTRIFPDGVCDWPKSGVSQVPVVPWASFGRSPRHRIN
jgi:hypothetical protein